MTEQEFLKTVAHRQIVDDDAIKRYAKTAVTQKRPVPARVWKPVCATLAVLLLLCGIVMTIPSARAEVLRWFAPTSPREYLSQPAEDREPNEALESLIVPAEENNTEIAVQDAEDDAIFREIAENLSSVTLGETLFDGETLYIRMHGNGVSMLASAEVLTGGTLTMSLIAPDDARNFFEDNSVPPQILSGEIPLWVEATVVTTFTFPDGTQLYGDEITVDEGDLRPLIDILRRNGLRNGLNTTQEQHAAINELELAYLSGRTLGATGETLLKEQQLPGESRRPDRYDVFSAHADENGMVTVTVGMEIFRDPGDGSAVSMLRATLGEVTVDLDAYRSLQQTSLIPDGTEAIFASEETFLSIYTLTKDETGRTCYAVTNEPVDLGGMTVKGLDGAEVDALGIRNLRILVTPPASWEARMRESLMMSGLSFDVLINGEPIGYCDGTRVTVLHSGAVLFTIGSVSDVPLALLNEVQTVTLIPRFAFTSHMLQYAADEYGNPGTLLSETPLTPGVPYVESRLTSTTDESTLYPDCAITFTVADGNGK